MMDIFVNGIHQGQYADSGTTTLPLNTTGVIGRQVQLVSLTEDAIVAIAEAVVRRIKEAEGE